MSRISWDKTGERFYETGVKNGVLYVYDNKAEDKTKAYANGVAWNGLSAVTESPSGAEATAIYADDIKYLNLMSAEEFGATVEAYTYPDEFAECDGSAELATGVVIGQQNRKMFGLCYKTTVGNDTENNNYGSKIHFIYGATASPSEKNFQTINDSPEAISFSWELTTVPVDVPGFKPTATLVIDTRKISPEALAKIEEIIYGTESTAPYLPLPEEVMSIVKPSVIAG